MTFSTILVSFSCGIFSAAVVAVTLAWESTAHASAVLARRAQEQRDPSESR